MSKTELPPRLSFQDAAFANFERSSFPMNVGSAGIYEGEIPFGRFLAHVDRRIQLVPRYWQRLVDVPGGLDYAAWIDDPHFDVRNHIEMATLPPPGSDEQLARFAATFFSTPLRPDRPLWEIRLVHGLRGGRSAHVAKVHHCLVDGIGGVGLLGAVLDTTPEPRHVERHHRPDPPPLPNALTLATNALFDRALAQIRLNERIALWWLNPTKTAQSARSIVRALLAAGPYFAVPAQRTPWHMRLHAPDRLAWQALPFDAARAVASTLGGTINDLALTLVAGGLGRYLESLGERTDNVVLRAALPVNVRREEHADALGNRISYMLAGLPVGVRDARERFRTIHAEVSELKKQQQAAGIEELMERLGDLPPAVHALTGRTLVMPNNLTNLIFTNVPGPLQPLYLQGHRMLHHYPWVPLGWRMGLSAAVMSYDAGLYFAVTADRETPGDIDVIARGIRNAFDELRTTTIVPEPYRRFVPPVREAPAEPIIEPPIPLGDEALMVLPN